MRVSTNATIRARALGIGGGTGGSGSEDNLLDVDGGLVLFESGWGYAIGENANERGGTMLVRNGGTVYTMNELLKNVMRSGGTGSAAAFSGMTMAGKTGTTTANNDVWFVGYSPYYTCGIWSGYDKGKTLVNGQTYQKDIWKRVMERIHKNLTDIGWKRDADIVTAKICSKSGLLAVDGVCGRGEDHGVVYTEYFTSQTVPTQYCTIHEEISICSESNRIAGDYCPKEDIIKKVYLRLTKEQLNTYYTTDDMKYAISTTLGKCSIHVAPTTTAPETTEAQTTKARETYADDDEE